MCAFKARNYQKIIIRSIIKTPRVAIFAGMGMGKTSATLAALSYLRHVEGEGPALVLAPLRVARFTWPGEAEKWPEFGLSVSAIVGTPAARRRALAAPADVYAINYEGIPWLVREIGDKWPFSAIVADESTRLKGFRLRKSSRAGDLARVAWKSARFIELTGTPSPNGLLDLWGQMYFIDRGERLGASMTAYQDRYFRPRKVGREAWAVKYDPRPGAAEAIQDALADVCVSLRPEDYFSLERAIDVQVPVYLPPAVLALYKRLQADYVARTPAGARIVAPNLGVLASKCLQIASGAVYMEDGVTWEALHDEKIEALRSIMAENPGESILVAYTWRFDAERVLAAIPGARMMDKNPETLEAWNRGKIPVLLVHPASAGHGLNLQDGGRILVMFSETWNLEHYLQVIERIGPVRQAQSGHPRSVFIYHITAQDTIDAAAQMSRRRKKRAEDVLLESLSGKI